MEEILLTIIAVLGVIVTYFAWRVADQMPDIAFRLSEIQRDMATVARKASEPGACTCSAGRATARAAASRSRGASTFPTDASACARPGQGRDAPQWPKAN